MSSCSFDTDKDQTRTIMDGVSYSEHTTRSFYQGVFYLTTGIPAGTTIVFIHGSPGGWSAWKGYLKDKTLISSFKMASMDRIGYGRSAGHKVSGRLEDQVRALRAVVLELNQVSDSRIVLVGHSYGGPVAIKYAMMFPKSVAALVLIASPADPELEEWLWFNDLADTSMGQFFLPRDWVASNHELKPLKSELSMIEKDWFRLVMPILVIQGAKDALVNPDNLFYMKRKLAHSDRVQFSYLADEGHFVIWTQKDLIKKLLRDFLISQKLVKSEP